MYLFRPLKYITDVTESKSIQIMKIAQFIYNYYIKRDETLGICIVKLPSRASNNGRSTRESLSVKTHDFEFFLLSGFLSQP